MDKQSEEKYLQRVLGKWYSWDSPVGLGIGLVCIGVFVTLLVLSGWLGADIANR